MDNFYLFYIRYIFIKWILSIYFIDIKWIDNIHFIDNQNHFCYNVFKSNKLGEKI